MTDEDKRIICFFARIPVLDWAKVLDATKRSTTPEYLGLHPLAYSPPFLPPLLLHFTILFIYIYILSVVDTYFLLFFGEDMKFTIVELQAAAAARRAAQFRPKFNTENIKKKRPQQDASGGEDQQPKRKKAAQTSPQVQAAARQGEEEVNLKSPPRQVTTPPNDQSPAKTGLRHRRLLTALAPASKEPVACHISKLCELKAKKKVYPASP